MQRWPLRISPRRAAFGGTICLILGAVTTVGVAWVFAMSAFRSLPGFHGVPVTSKDGRELFRATAEKTGVWIVGEFHGGLIMTPNRMRFPPGPPNSVEYTAVHVGWPMRSLSCEYGEFLFEVRNDRITGRSGLIGPVSGGLQFFNNANSAYPVALPFRPHWFGFLINTLFYAAIWFGLFFAMGRTRRFIRTRRGRCPRCGYDLRGEFDDGCSECGWNRAGEGTEASRQQGIEVETDSP